MIKIACMVLGHISNGELTIALEFTNRLNRDKYEVVYIVPSKLEERLNKLHYRTLGLHMISSPEENLRKFEEFIEKWNPDYFLLSDIYTLEYSGAWSGITWDIIKKTGIQSISFDEYDYQNNYTLDFMGGNNIHYPEFIEECNYRIYDCPINKKKEGQYCFKMYSDGFRFSREEIVQTEKKYRRASDEKIIMMVTSGWEYLNTGTNIFVDRFIKTLPNVIMGYMGEMPIKISIIHVSPVRWNVLTPNNIRYEHIGYLPEAEFNRVIRISDLFITTNIVSVTLTKAIYMGVPSIVLNNPKKIVFEKFEEKLKTYPEWYQNMAQELEVALPFRASVFGWTRFLEKVINDNEYMNTFVCTPLYKYNVTKEIFLKLLTDDEYIYKLKTRQIHYVKQLEGLDDPNTIMDGILMEKYKIS